MKRLCHYKWSPEWNRSYENWQRKLQRARVRSAFRAAEKRLALKKLAEAAAEEESARLELADDHIQDNITASMPLPSFALEKNILVFQASNPANLQEKYLSVATTSMPPRLANLKTSNEHQQKSYSLKDAKLKRKQKSDSLKDAKRKRKTKITN